MTSQGGVPDGVPEGVPEVDLVYAWVDGEDPQLQADIRRYAVVEDHLNP